MDVTAISDQLEITRVLGEYCQLCDDGDFAGLAQRFASDGSFEFGRRSAVGREALVEWFEVMQPPEKRGKHLTANSVIDVHGDAATVVSDFLFVQLSANAVAVAMSGRYHDEFRRVEGRWLIQRRRAVPLRDASSPT